MNLLRERRRGGAGSAVSSSRVSLERPHSTADPSRASPDRSLSGSGSTGIYRIGGSIIPPPRDLPDLSSTSAITPNRTIRFPDHDPPIRAADGRQV